MLLRLARIHASSKFFLDAHTHTRAVFSSVDKLLGASCAPGGLSRLLCNESVCVYAYVYVRSRESESEISFHCCLNSSINMCLCLYIQAIYLVNSIKNECVRKEEIQTANSGQLE